jgi:hypothetical protein
MAKITIVTLIVDLGIMLGGLLMMTDAHVLGATVGVGCLCCRAWIGGPTRQAPKPRKKVKKSHI